MKIKVFMLTGLLVVVLGFIGFAVAMTNLNWDFSDLNGDLERKVYAVEAEEATALTALEIEVDYADVTVERGEETKIEYDDSDKLEYGFSYAGGKLTVTQTQKSSFFKIWLFDYKTPEIKVTLSADCVDAALEVKNGITDINDFSFKTLDITNKNGAITLKRSDADKAAVENVNGAIVIEGFDCRGDFSVNNKNGYIGVKNCDADGALTIVGKNGEIDVDNCSATKEFMTENVNGRLDLGRIVASSVTAINKNGELIMAKTGCDNVMTVENKNGRITLTDIYAAKLIANGNNGDIDCERIECPDIYAKNNNGDIEFSVIGSASDYVITTKNNNGDVDVPKSGSGEKKIELINNNGDIDVEFV